MKKISLSLLFSLAVLVTFSQGVNFQHATVAEAYRLAKEQHKPLFVEIFSPTCHICQSFVPVFNEPVVGNFFNQNFINLKVDMNSAEFKTYFEKKKKVYPLSIPLMLFFDENENLLHHYQLGMGQGVEMVLTQGQNALNPEKRSGNWSKSFQSGNRDKNFLINYALQCRIFRDTVNNMAAVNELYKVYPKDQLNSDIGWLVNEKLVLDTENGFFQYWLNNFANAARYGKGHEKEVMENIIFGTLFSSRGAKFSSEKINRINGYLATLGFSKNEIVRKTMLPMTKALLRENQTYRAVGEVENYTKSFNPTPLELAYLVSVFNDSSKDGSYKTSAINWLKKAASGTDAASDMAEIHYQSAKLYLRLGDKREAEKAADLAVKNAKAARLDMSKFQNLIK